MMQLKKQLLTVAILLFASLSFAQEAENAQAEDKSTVFGLEGMIAYAANPFKSFHSILSLTR
jgi:hypothetical protein